MFKSKFFVILKTSFLDIKKTQLSPKTGKGLLNKDKLSNEYENYRCASSDLMVRNMSVLFFRKIHAPIS